eukprot:1157887-Pelagomonas_calceolata.AAC.3
MCAAGYQPCCAQGSAAVGSKASGFGCAVGRAAQQVGLLIKRGFLASKAAQHVRLPSRQDQRERKRKTM